MIFPIYIAFSKKNKMRNSTATKTIIITDDPIIFNDGKLEHLKDQTCLDDMAFDCLLDEDQEIELEAEIGGDGEYDLLGIKLDGEQIAFTPEVEKHFMENFTMYEWEVEEPYMAHDYR